MADLKLIPGGAAGLPVWLTYPHLCDVPSPRDRSVPAKVRVSAERAITSAAAQRRQPAFELWSIVFGTAPPVPNVAHPSNAPFEQGLSRLSDAHACFHGLKRPVAESDQGDEMLTYVLAPSHYYRFDTNHAAAMVTIARRVAVPAELLFLAHVRVDHPVGVGDPPMIGVVTHWGFAERSRTDPLLPVDFDTRFNGRHW